MSPQFVDYDADGDLDILSGSYTGEIYYFERGEDGVLAVVGDQHVGQTKLNRISARKVHARQRNDFAQRCGHALEKP